MNSDVQAAPVDLTADAAARDERHHNRTFSFRCKNCGRLEESAHAGELSHPASCRVCGRGVRFDPNTGVKNLDPDNWEVLADADDGRLAELGLTRDQVAEHAPVQAATPGRAPQHLGASASDGAGTTDGAG